MLAHESGTCSGSDLYFQTPSENAKRLLYYMTSCGYYYTDYDYRIEREDYNNYLLFYISEGRLSVTSGGHTLVAAAGQVGFINCHEPHEYHTIGNTEFLWLHMDGANTHDFYKKIVKQQGAFIFDIPCSEKIRKQISEIVFAYRNGQMFWEASLSYKLYGLLTTLLDGNPDDIKYRSASRDPVRAALDYIHMHYEEPISLSDIAENVSVSQYHLSRLFKKECGFSPYEFIIITRINRAKHLLKTTDLPIKIIAQNVGYSNSTTFTNAFTERVGLSPTLFRQYPI